MQKTKVTLRPQFHYSILLFLLCSTLLYFTLLYSTLFNYSQPLLNLLSTLCNLFPISSQSLLNLFSAFSTFSTFSTSAQSPLNLFSTFSPLPESYFTLLHSILLSPQDFRLLNYFYC